MIAVIFEVVPAEGEKQHYMDIAASLRDDLSGMDGFISVERFQSLTTPEKILSLSFWRDEEAAQQWRNLASHRAAQASGRAGIFQNYRLRVASVLRDYGLNEREQAPRDTASCDFYESHDAVNFLMPHRFLQKTGFHFSARCSSRSAHSDGYNIVRKSGSGFCEITMRYQGDYSAG